ncbi:MAG: nucleotidyl transferase AbiEii/AbiGii toxin family protein [Elusimicrobiota bacterium]|nr:nucleotidyl transferase AbiEii/AbiGii toxin family protein [Elusimicrobiota bacterium]
MKKDGVKNLSASIHQRLLNNARLTRRPFEEVLQYFAIERFLYRLSKSPHAGKFILKGALMLSAWEPGLPRPTKDIDLLGRTKNDVAGIVGIMRSVCGIKTAPPDGLLFNPAGVTGERIAENADYQGVRVGFWGNLGKARISMQIDIGFGDIVFPAAKKIIYPGILDMPHPVLRGYSKESIVAEKLEAMIKLDIINSRMKDFFDIWLLSRQFDFQGAVLAKAINKTFKTRATVIPGNPVIFTDTFTKNKVKQTQWNAFLRKNRLSNAPTAFSDTLSGLAVFLKPVLAALSAGRPFSASWKACGPWK